MIDKKTGKAIRGRIAKLTLSEIAGVDNPAQAHARMVIMKRKDAPYETPDDKKGKKKPSAAAIAKAVYAMVDGETSKPGPKTFADLVEEREQRQKEWKAYEELCPYFDALTESLRSIASAEGLTTAGRIDLIRGSVTDFMNAVAAAMPDVEEQLEKLLTKNGATAPFFKAGETGDHTGGTDMTLEQALAEIEKLKGSVSELTQKAAAAEAATAIEKQRADTAETKVVEVTKAKEAAEKDEVIKVGTVEVRKSVVGESNFSIFKAQQEEIAKGNNERELLELQKRAENTEYGSLPGEVVLKAKVLKAVGGLPEEERTALDTMLKAGNKALADQMKERGRSGDRGGSNSFAKAEDKIDAETRKYATEHKIESFAKAQDLYLQTEAGKKFYAEMQEEEKASRRAA